MSLLTLAFIVGLIWKVMNQTFHIKPRSTESYFSKIPPHMFCGIAVAKEIMTGLVVTEYLNKPQALKKTSLVINVVFSCWWSRWSCRFSTSGLSSTKTPLFHSGSERDSRYFMSHCQHIFTMWVWSLLITQNWDVNESFIFSISGTLSTLGHPGLQLHHRRLVSNPAPVRHVSFGDGRFI